MIEPSSVLFKASGIYSLVRKCVAAGMTQHVRMEREGHAGPPARWIIL